MKSIKFKIIALLMAFLIFTTSPARAVEPLTICLIVSAVAHVVVGGVLWRQGVFSQSGKGAATTADGSKIGRGATVQWIDTKDIDTNGLPKGKHKNVTVKIDGQKLMDAAKADPSKYPKLNDAAFDLSSSPPPSNASVGSSYLNPISGKVQTVTAHSCGGNVLYPSGPPSNFGSATSYSQYVSVATNIYKLCTTTFSSGGVPSVSNPVTLSRFAQKMANSSVALSGAAGIFSDKFGEIDEYIKSFPGSVTILDTSDPLNVATAPTATLPTPATQSGVNTAIAAAGARSAAQNAVTTAQGNYDANPSADNAQRLADAHRELARIIADQIRDGIIDNPDGTHNEDDDGDGDGDGDDEEEQDTGGFDLDPYGTQTDAELDFGTRFRDFFDQMRTTALFSLPNQFLSGLPSGGSSVMSFSAGRFGNHTFDFSLFSSLWTTLKTIILVLFAWLGVRIVTLKGGG